jgi:hypothetical protein
MNRLLTRFLVTYSAKHHQTNSGKQGRVIDFIERTKFNAKFKNTETQVCTKKMQVQFVPNMIQPFMFYPTG